MNITILTDFQSSFNYVSRYKNFFQK